MARAALVGVDAAVSAVGAAVGLRGLVDDDRLDNQVVGGELVGLGVGLGVLEQGDEDLGRLDGPSTYPSRSAKRLSMTHRT